MKKKYSVPQITAWLIKSIRKTELVGNREVRFMCPRCQHENFYFNLYKGVGHCHRASCGWNPNLEALIRTIGIEPGEEFSIHYKDDRVEPPRFVIKLPEACVSIVYMKDGHLMTNYSGVACHLRNDRNLTFRNIFEWHILLDIVRERIILPVYYQGDLKNYVDRAIWWQPSATGYLRYDYPKGSNIKDYLFGWDEAQNWTDITLVENTFNAIWLRELHAVSTFGTHLSDKQIELICISKVKNILIMWDHGSDTAVQKAKKRLESRGIKCRVTKFSEGQPQPDDWSLESLKQRINE